MLDERTVSVIQSTIPILEEQSAALTEYFYKRLFSNHPELLPYFNQANQVSGQQPRALAGAVCAYARNIGRLGDLSDAVERIAQKHTSLQVHADHYPIVGQHLLASFKEFLGPHGTDEVIEAWQRAYTLLAQILIAREAQICQEHVEMPGGWQGFKKFRLLKREDESDVITSFYFVPTDNRPIPLFKPGQYLTVRVPSPCGHTTLRHYSLSDKPGQNWLRISVKRETGQNTKSPDGYVSNFLHNHLQTGHLLEIAPPCGSFTLDMTQGITRPLMFVAAGVGITPLMSMALAALEMLKERQIYFIHGARQEGVQAFKESLDNLALSHPNFTVHHRYSHISPKTTFPKSTSSVGLIDIELIKRFTPERNADYYFCGPQPFMAHINKILQDWHVPQERIHFEFFGPMQNLSPMDLEEEPKHQRL
ncbi:MAG: NO-inducible flavohemoprotein [Alphaproteobacteria bacterium]|jgi:nitric oxide dioxygenase|nr:NO-inducible flavohemoprotein [Alphaproteobacteria bacterium]